MFKNIFFELFELRFFVEDVVCFIFGFGIKRFDIGELLLEFIVFKLVGEGIVLLE